MAQCAPWTSRLAPRSPSRLSALGTQSAAVLARSPSSPSKAGALRASCSRPRAQPLRSAQSPNVVSVVLEDASACEACWRFLDNERMLVEPACGVSVALAYNPDILKRYVENLGPESKVVIVVCGGSKISLALLNRYRQTYTGSGETSYETDELGATRDVLNPFVQQKLDAGALRKDRLQSEVICFKKWRTLDKGKLADLNGNVLGTELKK
ncbi:uncharacterized protein Z518_00129 [Rhinocladiella mackenziei CBS 650.93]|uniref:L-serine ammonia-lyase n=1 Tax=Rhinocladiella mackenziei CBS 650.93 TaxID=1442369 RepID=A0A0D2J0A6_9EURO|nr:uncharacterized protein Z518_00129 [Rhinocladiella mackenziei CBS 650.93]KIX09051.1 hypothetical protein Z518_00129 [Rhinocladiella mackenziei CBS 650.93]